MQIKNYVPILRPKQGELQAILELNEDTRGEITPLFDIHRISIQDAKKKKTYDDHFDKVVVNLAKYWGPESPFIFDLSAIELDTRMSDGTHPVSFFVENFLDNRMKFIISTGTDRDSEHDDAIRLAIKTKKTDRLCVRALKEDLDDPATFMEFCKTFGLAQGKIHLLVDLKYVQADELEDLSDRISTFCGEVEITKWASFVVSASGFPIDMSGIPANSTAEIPRTEFTLWKMIFDAEPLFGRKPKYSDYGLVNPVKPDMDPALVKAGGKIRYTTDGSWIVMKGHGLHKGEKYAQYKSLSLKLIKNPQYKGRDYSWGDGFVYGCAKVAEKKFGNLTTWVKVDTNHHLTFVVEQIASFGEI